MGQLIARRLPPFFLWWGVANHAFLPQRLALFDARCCLTGIGLTRARRDRPFSFGAAGYDAEARHQRPETRIGAQRYEQWVAARKHGDCDQIVAPHAALQLRETECRVAIYQRDRRELRTICPPGSAPDLLSRQPVDIIPSASGT